MSSLILGSAKERMELQINQTDLLAGTAQQIVCPVDGYIDSFEVVVQVGVTTGGPIVLNGGGAVYNRMIGLDTTSFPNAPLGDTAILPAVKTSAGTSFANTAATTPGIVVLPKHGLVPGQPIKFTGTVPTGVSTSTQYFVSSFGWSEDAFNIATTVANAWSGVTGTASGSASTSFSVVTGQQAIVPITGCTLTIADGTAAGAIVRSAQVPAGDPTNLVKAGQLLTVVPDAAFATAGAVNYTIRFRSGN